MRLHLPRPHASLILATIIVGLFAVLEIAVQTFTPFWDRLLPARNAKMAQYREVILDRRKYDYVFVGSSTTFMGVAPAVFDSVAKSKSYNAGQLGYSGIDVVKATVEEVISAQSADTIVYLFDAWAGGMRPSNKRAIDRHGRSDHMLWWSATFRNRDVLFFWIRALATQRWIPPSEAWHEHLKSSRRVVYFDGVSLDQNGYLETRALINPAWPAYLRPAMLGPLQERAFRSIVERCRSAGVNLIVVRPPEFRRTYLENSAVHARLTEQLTQILNDYGVPLIDFSETGIFPHSNESLFFDMHHVNAAGAPVLSRLLATALVRSHFTTSIHEPRLEKAGTEQ